LTDQEQTFQNLSATHTNHHTTNINNSHRNNNNQNINHTSNRSNLSENVINNGSSLLLGSNHSLSNIDNATIFSTATSASVKLTNTDVGSLITMSPNKIQLTPDHHDGYEYLHAFYWSMLSLFPVGGFPTPKCPIAYFYLICEGVIGMFLMATVLGHVSNIVTNVSAAQKEFQGMF
ncbi:uncharacterized protein DC041_0003193, partial [Schistosoma bovis]